MGAKDGAPLSRPAAVGSLLRIGKLGTFEARGVSEVLLLFWLWTLPFLADSPLRGGR